METAEADWRDDVEKVSVANHFIDSDVGWCIGSGCEFRGKVLVPV